MNMKRWRLLASLLIVTSLLTACMPRFSAGLPPTAGAKTQPLPLILPSAAADAGATQVYRDMQAEQRTRIHLALAERQHEESQTEEQPSGAPPLSPRDPLTPPPGAVPDIWRPLDQAVQQIAADFPGRMSVVAIDLATGARYDYRASDPYYPASTFKLPVALCTVQAIQRGELTWDTPITFTEADDDTVGQGAFATAPYGGQYPVRNLVNRSIISSNNVAVKMLARTLTWDGLRACTQQLGGEVTRTEAGSTPVSASDEAAWWLAVWHMHQETPAVAENLLGPLRQVSYHGRIEAGTPRPELVTHKFGTYPPYEHDGALVWSDHPYILVVMTYGGDHVGVDATIADIATAAWHASTAAPR